MTETRTKERGKWGNFDLTDEQAQAINDGNIDAFNAFFLTNYNYIEYRCKALMDRYQIADQIAVDDAVNSVYLDLQGVKFLTPSAIEGAINVSVFYADHGGNAAVNRNCPTYKSHRRFVNVQPLESTDESGATFCVVDLYRTAPTPQEEIDDDLRRAKENDLEALTDVVAPFLSKGLLRFFPFWVSGIPDPKAAERLSVTRGYACKSYQDIRHKLTVNYHGIVVALAGAGYDVERYLGRVPANYTAYKEQEDALRAYKAEYARKRAAAETQEEKERRLARRRAWERSRKAAGTAEGVNT